MHLPVRLAVVGLLSSACHRDRPVAPPTESVARAPEPSAGSPPAAPVTEIPPDRCTTDGLRGAVDGSAPWTDEGPHCVEVFAQQCRDGAAESCSEAALVSLERIGGAEPDLELSLDLLGRGCELESADACRNIGALHAAGALGESEPAAARAAARPFFAKACVLGSSEACEEADALAPKLVEVEGANVSAGSMTVDGLEVRDLQCAVEGGALLGTMAIAASLAERKKSLDRCAPSGQAFVVHWRFAGGKTRDVEVRGGSEKASRCASKAIAGAKAVMPARCGAIVLAGDHGGAEASLTALESGQ